jgi:uncharacterized membrane protein
MQLYSYFLTLVPAVLLLLQPVLAEAQSGSIQDISDVIAAVDSLVTSLIPIAASLALLAFIWGLAQYIFKAGDKEAKEEGQRIMAAGVISLFLIAAISGIIDLLAQSLDISTGGNVPVPGVGTGSGGG